jgi:hypothetical protein
MVLANMTRKRKESRKTYGSSKWNDAAHSDTASAKQATLSNAHFAVTAAVAGTEKTSGSSDESYFGRRTHA